MANNSYYFPQGYPQNYPQNYPQYQQPQRNSTINWVQGLEGAKAYPVGAGENVQLMDSEADYFFIKSVDQSGMPLPLRIFKYEEVTNVSTAKEEPKDYITREELDEILKDYSKKKQGVKKDGE